MTAKTATKQAPFVRIEAQRLMGNTYETYFVDLVTTADDGHKSSGNLRAVESLHLARQIASEVARAIPCYVEDTTMRGCEPLSSVELATAIAKASS